MTNLMDKNSLFKIVKDLPFDQRTTVFEHSDVEVQIERPSQLSKRFKNYDINKNFQIWLKEGLREFRPNHLRVLIDLNLRVRCRKDLKERLLTAFDNIYYGRISLEELEKLNNEDFEYFLNPLPITGLLAQLLLIEQEYCYHRDSKFEPPNLFLQGWIREFLDNPKEIDNLCMSVCRRQPPQAKYVNLENKKNKSFTEDLKPLWYLT